MRHAQSAFRLYRANVPWLFSRHAVATPCLALAYLGRLLAPACSFWLFASSPMEVTRHCWGRIDTIFEETMVNLPTYLRLNLAETRQPWYIHARKNKASHKKINYAIYAVVKEGLPRFRSSEWRIDLYSDGHTGTQAYGYTSIRAHEQTMKF